MSEQQKPLVAEHRGYWGYRELTKEELKRVDGRGCGCGCGCGCGAGGGGESESCTAAAGSETGGCTTDTEGNTTCTVSTECSITACTTDVNGNSLGCTTTGAAGCTADDPDNCA